MKRVNQTPEPDFRERQEPRVGPKFGVESDRRTRSEARPVRRRVQVQEDARILDGNARHRRGSKRRQLDIQPTCRLRTQELESELARDPDGMPTAAGDDGKGGFDSRA